jgi:N-acyl-D-aspartate/D-glutamate deacylase
MAYDLLIKGGRVIDGSGLPGYMADVGVKDGKVAEIGRLSDGATRTIDASGLVVAPGFIDHHTHLDGQLFWDPYGTCEPQNGVTTAMMGNCALTLAPVQDGREDGLVSSFVRVEAMPRAALDAGIPWGWHTYGEYLDALEGRVGINVGGLVGHIAVRQWIMGEEAVEREATDAEVEQMRGVVAESLRGGALGLSTNRNKRHMREDMKPIASRLATDEEFFRLADVCGEMSSGILQISLGLHTVEDVPWYARLAKRTGRPIIWQSVHHRWAEPNLWREQLDAVAKTFEDGYRTYGITEAGLVNGRFTLKNVQTFDEFPTWKNVMFLPVEIKKQALKDPETRARFREELATDRQTSFHRKWEYVFVRKVAKPENERFVDKSIAEVARMRGQDPVDAFLDLGLEEDLETTYSSSNTDGDEDVTAQILCDPHILVGQSDAGAHIQFQADFGYGTTLLGHWVRDKGIMSLERAVHKLSYQVAWIYGLQGRGLVQPGYAADLVLFNPDTVNACQPEWAQDFPANTRRMVQKSEGIHYTVVNGRVVFEDGALSGDLPGSVLRGSAYSREAAAV